MDDNNHLVSSEPPADYEVNIDNEWISDTEIYRLFSENNINFSNPYCTIQKILVHDKGIVFFIFYVICNSLLSYLHFTTLFIRF